MASNKRHILSDEAANGAFDSASSSKRSLSSCSQWKPSSSSASSLQTPTTTATDEELTCDICKKFYKSPKIMPQCQHTFCLQCLYKLKTSASGTVDLLAVICPSCKTPSFLGKNGVKGFADHVTAARAIKARKLEERKAAISLASNATDISNIPIVSGITAISKMHFVVRLGYDKMMLIDKEGVVVGKPIELIHPPNFVSASAKVISNVAFGRSGIVYYSTSAIEPPVSPSSSVGRALTNVRHVKLLQDGADSSSDFQLGTGSNGIVASGEMDGLAVVDDWHVLFTSSDKALYGYMPIDSQQQTATPHFVTLLGAESTIHGLISLDTTSNTCRLLYSTQGRLMIVNVERTLAEKKKFRSKKLKVTFPNRMRVNVRKLPVFVLHGNNKFAVVRGSRLQVFELSCYNNDATLIGDFKLSTGASSLSRMALIDEADCITTCYFSETTGIHVMKLNLRQ